MGERRREDMQKHKIWQKNYFSKCTRVFRLFARFCIFKNKSK